MVEAGWGVCKQADARGWVRSVWAGSQTQKRVYFDAAVRHAETRGVCARHNSWVSAGKIQGCRVNNGQELLEIE